HYNEVLPLFLDLAYSRSMEDSILVIHAIFDQYLPVADRKLPSMGVVSQLEKYFQALGLLEHDARALETRALTERDQSLAAKTQEHAGTLMHLAFCCLVHPNAVVRSRAFDFIVRLVPTHFGANRDVIDSPATVDLRSSLEVFKGGFCALVLERARGDAV